MGEIEVLMFLMWTMEYIHRNTIKHDDQGGGSGFRDGGTGMIGMTKQTS